MSEGRDQIMKGTGQYLSFIRTYEGIHGCAPAEADLQGLHARETVELIETIGKIVLAFPQTLGLFGVAGFDETDDVDDGRAD